jgi:hypothetical protein
MHNYCAVYLKHNNLKQIVQYRVVAPDKPKELLQLSLMNGDQLSFKTIFFSFFFLLTALMGEQ